MVSDDKITESGAKSTSTAIQSGSWFATDVQPHRASLRRYLHRIFPTLIDVDDIIQESCLRIWNARLAGPIQFSKAFLFKIGRNLALDVVRRERASPIDRLRDFSTLDVIEDGRGIAATAEVNEKVRVLADAVAALPNRCREIVILRKFEGLSQKEVAGHLQISERTVEVQVARGVKRCKEYLLKRGIKSLYGDES